MATGFAAGLAQGLQNAEEQSLRRDQENRISAIQTANLGMAMEDQAYKRDERDRAKALREEMAALWAGTYGNKEVDVTEPVPGAIPTDSGTSADMVRTVKKQIAVAPGDRSPEGRARDLDFFNKMTGIRAKYSEFTPEQMKQSLEYGRYLEKEGIEDGLMKLMISGDASGLSGMATRLGLDPKSLSVVSDGKAGYPRFTLNAVTTDGKPISQDLEPILTPLGIKSLTDTVDKNLSRKKAIADTKYSEAKAEDATADAALSRARVSEVGSQKVNTADKDYLPKIPVGADKPVTDPGAGVARRQLESIAKGSGKVNGAKASQWASEAHAKISAVAQQRVDAEEKASGKKFDTKTYNEKFQSTRNQILNDFIARQKRSASSPSDANSAE